MVERLKRAELIIHLDYPGWLCVLRLVRRWFRHKNKAISELPKEALEELNPKTLWKVLTRKERIRIENTLKLFDKLNLVRFHSSAELKEFLILILQNSHSVHTVKYF